MHREKHHGEYELTVCVATGPWVFRSLPSGGEIGRIGTPCRQGVQLGGENPIHFRTPNRTVIRSNTMLIWLLSVIEMGASAPFYTFILKGFHHGSP